MIAAAIWLGGAHAARAQTVVGDWEGLLKVGATTLRFVLHVKDGPDGLIGSLDSPSQGVTNVPVSEISFKDGKLTLTIDVIAASYAGTMSADGLSIEGTLSQGDQASPLVFARIPPARQ